MPEGDTVYLAAKRMDAALTGRTLTTSDFRVPDLAAADLVGQQVSAVVPRGKHLLTRFSGGLTLHTHFRMDGSWHLYAPGAPWRGAGPQHQVRVVLANADAVAVGMRLPVVELLPSTAEDQVVGHLGPDVLDPGWDESSLAEVLRRLKADPDREIGMALLDQRVVAGLGNLYRTEVQFLRGITPWTRVQDARDLPALVRLSRRLLLANADRWEQATTGDTRPGKQHWVFERAGKPCRRCGTRILEAEQGDPPRARITTWCPRCQAGPAPTAAQAAAWRRAQPPPPGTHRRYRN